MFQHKLGGGGDGGGEAVATETLKGGPRCSVIKNICVCNRPTLRSSVQFCFYAYNIAIRQ